MVKIVHLVQVVQVARGVKVIFYKKNVSNFRFSDLFSYLFIACKAFQKTFMTFKTFMYLLAHFYFRLLDKSSNSGAPVDQVLGSTGIGLKSHKVGKRRAST